VRGRESEGGRECESESESERVIMMEGGGRVAWLKANRPQVRGREREGGRECERE